MAVPQKVKNTDTIGCSNPSSGYLPEKLENICLQKCMYPCVHCRIIHSGQDMETTEVPFTGGLDTDAEHVHNGILLGHKER